MALALADSLAESKTLDCRDLMDRFVKWWQDGDYSCTGHCFDIGNTTQEALARYLQTGDSGRGFDRSLGAGNGSLMRLAPLRSGSGTTGRACSQQPPTRPGRPTEPRKQWTPVGRSASS